MKRALNLSLPGGVLALCVGCLVAPLRAESAGSDPVAAAQKLVATYCVSCHSDQRSEGDLRLDSLDTRGWNDYDLFDGIVARIEDGDMPPDDADKPLAPADKSRLLSVLKSRLTTLDAAQLAGQYKKLTAQEYSNSLADVFGFPVTKLTDLPFDSEHDIKKLGEHQVVTSYAVKKYYSAAREYLEEHLIHESMAPRETRFSAKNGKDLFGRQYTTTLGAVAGGGNPPIFVLKSPVTSYAEEGEYELEFDWYCFYGPRDKPEQHERVKPIRTPQINYHRNRTNSTVLNAVKEFADGRIFTCAMDRPIRIVLKQDMKFLSFRGPDNGFKSFDKTDPRYVKLANSDLPKDKKRAALKSLGNEMMEELHGGKDMFILIQGATFRGPLDKPETPFNVRLFGNVKRTDSIESCLPIIKDVVHKLFRRPVSDEVLQDYYAIARAEYGSRKNSYQAMKATLNAMLCSPHFLFKYEGSQEDLDDYMIAARLSYFLWNSTPDDELLKLASQGKLQDPAVRREQALRLLAEREKSDRFTANFTRQWLGLHKFGAYTPNEAYILSRLFNPLKPHLQREPQAFFNEVLHENLSALNFVHSDFVVWNEHLSSHYHRGTPNLKIDRSRKDAGKDEFYRRQLQENPGLVRGGLMTMSSIMSLTTDGENTHPILRGVWVARRMLGTEIAPPATVPAIEVNLENVSKPREILAKHKEDRSCYVCHVKFDHFGLALENYDVIGRWKTEYVHPVQDEKGKFTLVTKDPIDSLAEGPDGKPMPGVAGVKEYLMAHKGTVMRNLVERLYSYALGRQVRYRDRGQIDTLLKSMKANDYKLQDLILELVESKSFAER